MCLRLLVAISGEARELPALAFRCGLDLRAPAEGSLGQLNLIELAWGDCACALATRADGGERLARFAEELCAGGARVQVLLIDQLDEPRFGPAQAAPLAFSALSTLGLAALELGTAVELVLS